MGKLLPENEACFYRNSRQELRQCAELLSRANELAWAAREELIKHRAKVNSPAVSAWNDMLTDNQKLMIILKEKDYELLIDYMDASLEMAWLCRDYAAAQIHKPKSAAKKEPDNSPAV